MTTQTLYSYINIFHSGIIAYTIL